MDWSDDEYDQIFDFRTRAWHLEAVTSPKDVIILLDKSGSMSEKKWVTGKKIVNHILDTLGDNDYVNVYVFNETTTPLVSCFDFTLMQVNLCLFLSLYMAPAPSFVSSLSIKKLQIR